MNTCLRNKPPRQPSGLALTTLTMLGALLTAAALLLNQSV